MSTLALMERRTGVPPTPPSAAGTWRGRGLPILVGCLAASWVIPLAFTALHLSLLLLPILVIAVASLVRVGGNLLDRLAAAALVVAGVLLVFGLLFSLWPWGLAPVPTAGVLLTATTLSGWLARRAPRLPLRWRASDLLVLGTGWAVWHYLHHPLLGRSPAERLGWIATSEDRFGHFSYFDGIVHVGGYAFLHQEAARHYMMSPAEAVYPQGSHFLLAWIDALVRSSTDPGPALGEINRYFLYILLAYALLSAALVWAVRWIAGPRLRGWRCTAVLATVAALIFSSNYSDLVGHGFDSTVIGLLFLTVSLALLVRPAMDGGAFLLISMAALVTVTYAYNLYGAFVGLALIGTSVIHRRRFAKRRLLLHGLQAVGAAIAALPSVISVLSKLDVAGTSNLAGPMVGADRAQLLGGGLLALLAAAAPVNRRTGPGRALLLAVAGAALVIGGFGWWQLHTIGYYSYYFEKLAAAGVVIGLISMGMVGNLLRPAARNSSPLPRRWANDGALSVVAIAAAASLFAGMQWGVLTAWNKPSAWYSNPLVAWSVSPGTDIRPMAETFALRDIDRVSGPVIALYSDDSYQNLRSTFLAQLLTRQGGDMVTLYGIFSVKIGGDPVPDATFQTSMAKLRDVVAQLPSPPTILVANQHVADRIRADLAAHELRASVLHASVTLGW